MGMSANAYHAFGFDLGCSEDFLRNGVEEIFESFGGIEVVGYPYYSLPDNCPFELLSYGHSEYRQYFMALKGTVEKAYLGECVILNLGLISGKPSETIDDYDEAIAWAEEHGFQKYVDDGLEWQMFCLYEV